MVLIYQGHLGEETLSNTTVYEKQVRVNRLFLGLILRPVLKYVRKWQIFGRAR